MIRTPRPQYGPKLTSIINRLEYLRNHTTVSSTSRQVFIQLKHLLHITEAFGKICQGHKQNFFDKFISSLFLS